MLFKIVSFFIYLFKVIFTNYSKSDFIISFKKEVLKPKPFLANILKLRKLYSNSNIEIIKEDYGAGSKTIQKKESVSVKSLYKKVGISHKYGLFLYNLVNFLKAEKTLELGTSLGLSAAYLSNSKVTTIEGNNDLANKTLDSLKENGFSNIEVIKAKFDDVLTDLLQENNFDLIFIDGNHTEEATLRYFNMCLEIQKTNIVIVFDDIYWSNGMKNAWLNIKQSKDVNLSIDLFKFGIAFINNKSTRKEDITLWY